MAIDQSVVRVVRWTGGQHPTLSGITRDMKKQGLRPFMWDNAPNHRYAVRSHGYDKVLYVIEGNLEITLPDSNQRMRLRSGDRIDIPAGVRHGTIVGSSGVKCVEAALSRR
ncbi:MAG: cupin domain-containing protein [Burkholderiales bacterium]|nr:cupin domain-containing protein [Anaerolineae bacterium]